ncbi:MAG: hypothetical protein HC803_04420 [Saprospiraceae bacterium]|nr:hypothetical protein [Saprospiraceae bacterium]
MMTGSLIHRKYALIQEIMSLDTSDALQLSEVQLQIVKQKEVFWKAAKPMRKNLTLDMIKKEQNYQPIDEKTFFEKAAKVEVEEPLDDLLAMLTP